MFHLPVRQLFKEKPLLPVAPTVTSIIKKQNLAFAIFFNFFLSLL